jgi:phytoene dehydrogenase-like protein
MTDAVVIGSGPNGLVAANLLADHGWSVTVLEAQSTIGGAVRSDSEVAEGFVHDTFSAFYPFGAASPAIKALHLEDHGLRWVHTDAVEGHVFPDGRWAVIHREPEATAAGLDELRAGDGQAWLEMYAMWQRVGADLMGALLSPFPPVKHGALAAVKAPSAGLLEVARMLVISAHRLGIERFAGEGGQLLLNCNALHADFPLDGPGSGLFGWIMCMLAQEVGFPVPEGGAGRLTEAMGARLRSKGGEIVTGAQVERIVVQDGRAVGVEVAGGERIIATKAVCADVTASNLYGGLVSWDDLPSRVRADMRRFELDPATMKVDWALSGAVPWKGRPEKMPASLHIADSIDALLTFAGQLSSHRVPAEPFLLVGQMTTADPTRSPAGTESMWAYTHVPQEVHGDAGDEGLTGVWDSSETERFADRMQARVEKYAPGFGDRVIARRVLGPRELESRNENLVGGSVNGGTAAVHQQLIFRPIPGLGRAETPVKGLYLTSASAHPGGGVHGAPGRTAARAAIAHDRVRRPRRKG